jgi:PAS domain S-box-containing protein
MTYTEARNRLSFVPQNLQSRLMLMLGGILLVLLAIIVLAIITLVTQAENASWRGRLSLSAQATGLGIRQALGNTLSSLRLIADSDDAEHLKELITGTTRTFPEFIHVAVLNADREILVDVDPANAQYLNDEALDEWFDDAMETPAGAYFISEISLNDEGEPYIYMASPRPDGTLLAAAVDLHPIDTLLQNNLFGETGNSYLVEAEGQLVAHSQHDLAQQNINLAGRQELLDVDNALFVGDLAEGPTEHVLVEHSYTNFQGIPVLGTVKVVSGTDLLVFTEVAQSEAYAGSRTAIIMLIAAAIIFYLVSILAMSRILRSAVFAPLRLLSEGEKIVAKGNLTHQVPITRMDEIGVVTQGFNTMVQELSRQSEMREIIAEKLRTSEADMRSILDNTPSIIIEVDAAGRMTFVHIPGEPTDQMHQYLGQPVETMLPESAHADLKLSLSQVFSGQPAGYFESHVEDTSGGAGVWYSTVVAPVISNGQTASALLVSTNITERKQSEKQIQTQNEALVKTNRELAVARMQAESASKLKSQFLATMSHELRTPLNAVIGYAQLQLAGMAGDMTDEQEEFQERILANAQHLLGLINEVLDLSKIEAGRMEMAERPFSVRDCLQEVMRQNRVLAENKSVGFELAVADDMPDVVVGDQSRIRQVLINLVSNAIKFTDEGSVRVEAGRHGEDAWSVSVTDTGIGIAPHLQETVFDEFRQAENGIQRGGTGLGLAIVRKLVLMMNGRVRLNSELGKGSTFTVILPLVTQPEPAFEAVRG